MKNIYLLIGLALLAGCGKENTPAIEVKVHYVYPALNESSLPPAPSQAEAPITHNPSELPATLVTIKGRSGLQIEIGKIELIERLRAYAAQADPDDPFALTEEAIEAFSKLNNPILQ